MSDQPEALRLADALDGASNGPMDFKHKAAAELRRLYAEVDRLSYRLAYPDNFMKEHELLAWCNECRIELVTAIHSIASDYENAIALFQKDGESRRKAEGDIAHARKIAAKWNWNGSTTPPRRLEWVGMTDEEIAEAGKLWVEGERMLPFAFAHAIEARLKEKNA